MNSEENNGPQMREKFMQRAEARRKRMQTLIEEKRKLLNESQEKKKLLEDEKRYQDQEKRIINLEETVFLLTKELGNLRQDFSRYRARSNKK